VKKVKKLSLIVLVLGCLAFASIFQPAAAYADGSGVLTKQLSVTFGKRCLVNGYAGPNRPSLADE